MPEPLNPAEWPRWFHHIALASVLCATPDEAADLPEGYRREPYSEEEKRDHAKAQREAAERGHAAEVERLERALTTPVTPAQVKQVKRAHRRTRR